MLVLPHIYFHVKLLAVIAVANSYSASWNMLARKRIVYHGANDPTNWYLNGGIQSYIPVYI